MSISARLLFLAAALGFLPVYSLLPAAARAEAPQVNTQAPGFYRLMLGAFEVTALYDGYFDLDANLLYNMPSEAIRSRLAERFNLRDGKFQTAVNAYLINTGTKLVLVDAGNPSGSDGSAGHLLVHLKAAGYAPEQVDAVLLTHLHGDHAGGLLNVAGKALFPNATIYMSKTEADFWLPEDAAKRAIARGLIPKAMRAEQLASVFRATKAPLAPYEAAGRVKTFEDGERILPGIRSLAAHGHTPGHAGFEVESNKAKLLIWGDIVHSAAVQFAQPAVGIAFDSDDKQAVATRKAILKRAAREKLLIAGMHLPFPGIGHVVTNGGESYEWIPVEYSPIRE
ncbi:MAG: MBL fold metallo-hydrolase [Zoogloeaceae bacterium]|jgi:glyoxylase-like metal-dependent hydrolase (beta-lactamase superfamily II)|nr:MBL fold metallo-hydrolase [Zoogloeaceae bacterium]